jgi:spoIIIJ-associated protein
LPPTKETPMSEAPDASGTPATEPGDAFEAPAAPDISDAPDAGDDANVAEEGEAAPAAPIDPQDRIKLLEAEGDIAADYLEELLDIADLDGDLDMDVEGDRAAVSIVGSGLDALVGEDGRVLEAVQELTRLAVYRETGERSRLMLDIGGFRAELRKNLELLAQEAIDDVKQTGEAVKLAPMTPFERKVVHDAVAAAGLSSESEGVEPTRCVVVLPGS